MGLKTVTAVLAVCGALVGSMNTAHAQDSIRIGDINSYTRLAAFTEPYRKGIELAVEEINAAGGVLGQPLEFIFKDDQGEPGEAIKVAEELISREEVVMLSGTILSNVSLALASYAERNEQVFLVTQSMADAIVWEKGNDYTYRLTASTYMQAAMLAQEAAKSDAVRFATIAPNYAYGKDAVRAFQEQLLALRPDVEFVTEQWPALFKIDAGAEVQAIERANPDAIYNVTFGTDMAKFVREGTARRLFEGREVYGLLSGQPEYLEPLKDEAPVGWIATGYPYQDFGGEPSGVFVDAYIARWNENPVTGSMVGYVSAKAIAAAIEDAGDTSPGALQTAFSDLMLEAPSGPIQFRSQDNQSTLGAYVGTIALVDGVGVLTDWTYFDGADYLPSDDVVEQLRP